jgi:hypothetical protein
VADHCSAESASWGWVKLLTFRRLTALFPVRASSERRASAATVAPSAATSALPSKPTGERSTEIVRRGDLGEPGSPPSSR